MGGCHVKRVYVEVWVNGRLVDEHTSWIDDHRSKEDVEQYARDEVLREMTVKITEEE
jgi:outer membrane usher protein FimD/PapC